jgi:zinc D-Ala-D-Ala carboxypeptidase
MLSQLLALLMSLMNLTQVTLAACISQTNLGGNLYLVNRTYTIDRHYEPADLVHPNVKCSSGNVRMRREAAEALEQLFQAAKDEQGYVLVASSGYRSWGQQQAIYRRKIANMGSVSKAGLLVAPPGASEHQLGLAMDISRKSNQSLAQGFGATAEGKWVAANAHRFGFIIRYGAESTDITGYAYEPWHIRYVGVEHAQRIWEYNIPLDTYVEQLRLIQLSKMTGKGDAATVP